MSDMLALLNTPDGHVKMHSVKMKIKVGRISRLKITETNQPYS